MRKNKLMLPILAVIVGVAASAFTTIRDNQLEKTDVYYWFESSADGSTLQQFAISDSPTENSPNGCILGAVYCARGFLESQTIVDPVTQHRELASGVNPSDSEKDAMKNQ